LLRGYKERLIRGTNRDFKIILIIYIMQIMRLSANTYILQLLTSINMRAGRRGDISKYKM
jgi:hypothetical protein